MTARGWLWLGLWTGLGALLRFWGLESKPLWTDEFATIVFSLGHSFRTIPLDQVMSARELLAPAMVNPVTSGQAAIASLLDESNHPPLFFWLTHWWLRGLSGSSGLVSIWVVRSLPAMVGVLLIPLTYGIGWLMARSQRVALLAAAVMAVSPFAVYLSQEARHYTLPMVWILGSVAGWLMAVRSLREKRPCAWWIVLGWIAVNSLGMATHYFFAFTLLAEAIALLLLTIQQHRIHPLGLGELGRLLAAVVGTIAGCAVWIPVVVGSQDSELTRWIFRDTDFWSPIGQAIAGWVTMLYLLPIQSDSEAIVIGSAIALIILFLATIIYLALTLPHLWQQWELRGLVVMVVVAIALFLGLTYGVGIDITSAFRYNFVYFPMVVLIMAAALGSDRLNRSHKTAIALLLSFALIGSLTVITNLGYQKTHRPDRVASAIADLYAQAPQDTIVAIAHRTHGQTGRLMAIAWDLRETDSIRYLLAHQAQPTDPIASLNAALEKNGSDRPLMLWLVNMETVPEQPLNRLLSQYQCQPRRDRESVDGYRFQPFRCG
jgi:uncharacterized membrane protein